MVKSLKVSFVDNMTENNNSNKNEVGTKYFQRIKFCLLPISQ
jgi:hypothetical protein